MNKWCLCLIFMLAFGSEAASHCAEKRQLHIEYSRCLDQELEKLQREVSSWENSHLFRLEELEKNTGRGEPLKVFKRSRKQFQLFSTDHCRWQYLALIPDSQAGTGVYKECMLEQLKIQVTVLQQLQY